MERLDTFLGVAEIALVPASLGLLLVAALRGRRRLRAAAIALSVVTGVLVAHPFGVVTERLSAERFWQPGMVQADPNGTHAVTIAGLPILSFRPYVRPISYLNGEVGYPSHTLRLRSWVWPGVLTTGTPVGNLCGDLSDPCWRPGRGRAGDNLELWRTPEGGWRVRVLSSYDETPPPEARRPPGQEDFHAWELSAGITSATGLAFWLLTGLSVVVLAGVREPLLPAVESAGGRRRGRTADPPPDDRGQVAPHDERLVIGRSLWVSAVVVLPIAAVAVAWAGLSSLDALVPDDPALARPMVLGLAAAFYAVVPAVCLAFALRRGVPGAKAVGLAALSGLLVPAYQLVLIIALLGWLAQQGRVS